MKHDFSKVMLLLLVLVLAFAFAGCDLLSPGNVLANVSGNGNQDNNDQQHKEIIEAIEEIRVVADNAATKEALNQALELLNTVKDTADNAATKAALDEAYTLLNQVKGVVATLASKEELDSTLADIAKLRSDYATKEALNEAISNAEKNNNALKDELNSAISKKEAEINEMLAKVQGVLEGFATKEELNTLKSELEKIKNGSSNQDSIDKLEAEIKAELENMQKDVADNAKAIKELNDAIEAIKNMGSDGSNGEYAGAILALQQDLNKAKADIVTATSQLSELNNALASLNELVASSATKAELQRVNEELESFKDEAIVKAELEGKLSQLETKIKSDINAQLSQLNQSVSNINASIGAINSEISAIKESMKLLSGNPEALEQLTQKLENIEKTIETIDTIKSSVDEAKALAKEAKELAEEAKKIAEQAAAKNELNELADQLESVYELAQNATTKQEFNALCEQVYEILESLKSCATNEELSEVISELQALSESATKKEDFDALLYQVATLEGVVAKLEEDINKTIGEIGNEISDLKNEVNESKANSAEALARIEEIEQLLENIALDNFKSEYKEVNDILFGDGEYSYYSFLVRVYDVLSGDYGENSEEYKAQFEKSVEHIKIFLVRAMTLEDVYKAFEMLEEAKANLTSSLEEQLKALLNEITVINLTESCTAQIERVEELYTSIIKQNATVSAATEEEYLTKKAAYDNLVSLKGEAEINIDDALKDIIAANQVLLSTDSTEIEQAQAAISSLVSEILNSEYFELYTSDLATNTLAQKKEAAKAIAGTLYKKQETDGALRRYELLLLAKNDATRRSMYTHIRQYAMGWEANTWRPLHNEKLVETEYNGYNAWLTSSNFKDSSDYGSFTACMNDIEYENAVYVFGGSTGEFSLESFMMAREYYNYMFALASTGGGYNLGRTLENRTRGDIVLDSDAINNLISQLTELDLAIESANGYISSVDGNKTAMVSQETRDKVSAIIDANEKITELIDTLKNSDGIAYENDVWIIENFNAGKAIANFRSKIDAIYAEVIAISTEANKITSVKSTLAESTYEAVLASYEDFAKLAIDAYITAFEAIDKLDNIVATNGKLTLDLGNDIYNAINGINDAIVDGAIKGLDLNKLFTIPVDGVMTDVQFRQLYDRLYEYNTQYRKTAVSNGVDGAEDVAAVLTAEILDIQNIDATNINNYYVIIWAYNKFIVEWVDVYFVNMTPAEAVAATDAVKKVGGGTYAFITNETFKIIKDKYDLAVKTYAAVEKEASAWIASADNVMASYTFHEWAKFKELEEEYQNLITKYYNNFSETTDPGFGLYATHEAFKLEYAKCEVTVAEVLSEIYEIVDAVKTLKSYENITIDNYAAERANIDSVNILVTDFEKNYCADIRNDGDCIVDGVDYMVVLAKAEAVIKLYEVGVGAVGTTINGVEITTDYVEGQAGMLKMALGLDAVNSVERVWTIYATYESYFVQ